LETEHDNLRAALAWSTSAALPAHGLRLAGALWWFWAIRHHWQEGTEWLTSVLQRPDTALFQSERAKPLAAATDLTWDLGENERSAALAEQSLALFRKVGHT
jgi:hypothetical protein